MRNEIINLPASDNYVIPKTSFYSRFTSPPRNPGTAYYYDDYRMPETDSSLPGYIRPQKIGFFTPAPSKACTANLLLENEPVDILVDRYDGLYVQGAVTSVDLNRCDFTATYSSPDGLPLQKSFHTPTKLESKVRNIVKGAFEIVGIVFTVFWCSTAAFTNAEKYPSWEEDAYAGNYPWEEDEDDEW